MDSKSERVDSLVREGAGAIQCLGVQQLNSGRLIYGSSHLTTGLRGESKWWVVILLKCGQNLHYQVQGPVCEAENYLGTNRSRYILELNQ